MPEMTSLPNLGPTNTIVYGCIVGAKASGINVTENEEEKRWIYVQSPQDFFLNGYRPVVKVDGREVVYELRKFLDMAVKASPTALEMLFADNSSKIYIHSVFRLILQMNKDFLSKECCLTLCEPAMAAFDRARLLNQYLVNHTGKMRQLTYIDYCYHLTHNAKEIGEEYKYHKMRDMFGLHKMLRMGLSYAATKESNLYNIYWGINADFGGIRFNHQKNQMMTFDPDDKGFCIGLMYFDKEGYLNYKESYERATSFIKSQKENPDYITAFDYTYNAKEISLALRSLQIAEDIGEFGEVIMRCPNSETLKDVRKGKMTFPFAETYGQSLYDKVQNIFADSKLQDKFINYGKLRSIQNSVRNCINVEIEKKMEKHLKSEQTSY